jgi:hypothetical protein
MAAKRTPGVTQGLARYRWIGNGFVVAVSSVSLGIERNAKAGRVGVDGSRPQVCESCNLQADGRAGFPCPSDPFDTHLSTFLAPSRRYDTLYGSGHSSLLWKIRSRHANVKTVFSSLLRLKILFWMGLSCEGQA